MDFPIFSPTYSYYYKVKKSRSDKDFIRKPTYQGGQKALNAFIYSNIKMPKTALEASITGSVYLRYSIDSKGKVVETTVISSLGHGCDEEAVRVVKLLKFQVEKVFRRRVLFHKKIRIWFKPKQVKPATTSISYQLQSASKPTSNPKPKPSYGYTFTIKKQ